MLGLVLFSVEEALPLPSTTSPRVSGVERSCVSLSLDLGLLLEVSCHGTLALGHAFALMMITHFVYLSYPPLNLALGSILAWLGLV